MIFFKFKNWKLYILLFILTSNSFFVTAQNKDISYLSSGGKLNPLQAAMDIRHYTITLDVDIDKKSIQGYTEIDIILSKAIDTLLLDLVHLLKVESVKVNNKSVHILPITLHLYKDSKKLK